MTGPDTAPGKTPGENAVGRTATSLESIGYRDLAGLAGVLGYPLPPGGGRLVLPWPEDDVPPFAHWLNANPTVARDQLGPDGHPRPGGFLPALPYPRRMWAGSRVELIAPYGVDQLLSHRKTITSITPRRGRSGEMIFVSLLHEFFVEDRLVVREAQDLVYRPAASAATPPPDRRDPAQIRAAFDHDWQTTITPDPVWLMHYSAISFNGHRIHYDRDYATQVERYPALVVHGPLTASLLVDLYQRHNPRQRVTAFEWRGLAPLYDSDDFQIMGKATDAGAELWAVGPDGQKAALVSVQAHSGR
jgi:3-methylfumaryl-CoA hydratase